MSAGKFLFAAFKSFSFLTISFSATASNVMVIDGGLHPEYQQYLDEVEDRLLKESCYSVPGDKAITKPEEIDGLSGTHYFYKWVSLCRNVKSEQHGDRASVLRDDGIKSIRNAGSRNRDLEINHPDHQAIVADVITQNTAASVKQWHVHIQRLLGAQNSDGGFEYTRATSLQSSGGTEALRRALEDVAFGREGLDGVSVINLSGGANADSGNVYSTPCDGNPEITRDDVTLEIMNYIDSLYRRGVVTVVASSNETGDRLIDNYKMPFPACLSRTVAVAGYREYSGEVRGAISPHTDFVHDMNHPNPLFGQNANEEGTSFAAPKVSAHIAQLGEISTVRNVFGMLNALRETAHYYVRERVYNNGQFRVQFSVLQPNFQQARSLVIDSFWSDLFRLNTDGAVRNDQVGWNYGSNSHRNGVRIEMTTLPPLNQKVLNKVSGSISATQQSVTPNSEVLRFSLSAYDIDTDDEVSVSVNGVDYGRLSRTSSNSTGGQQTFCIAREDLNPTGETNEITLEVKSPGETWGVTDISAKRSFDTSGCKFAVPTFGELPDNDDRIVGSGDAFGNAYSRDRVATVPFSFDLFGAANLTPETYSINTISRDIRIKFTTKSGTTSSSANRTSVIFNGIQLLLTESFFGNDERNYELIVNRNRFRSGGNSLVFKPNNTSANSVWGIRGISVEYIEPITLSVGSIDNKRYGFHQSPSRYTGLRANFDLPTVKSNLSLSMTGWGINRIDETQVYINGVSVGFMSQGSANSSSQKDKFLIKKSFLKQGLNQIEFVQRFPSAGWSGISHEQWAVENLQLSEFGTVVTPAIYLLLDDD